MNLAEKIIDDEFSDVTLEILNKYDHLRLHVKDAMKEMTWVGIKTYAKLPCEIKPTDEVSLDLWFEQWYNRNIQENETTNKIQITEG